MTVLTNESLIKQILEVQRRALLDLTYRNRLLNLPKKANSRSIVVHDELSKEVFRLLMDKKAMTFAALPGGDAEEELSAEEQTQDEDAIVLQQPEDEGVNGNGVAVRHIDSKLQTKLKSEHLQKRLLEFFYESRMLLEEQGVNVLYLALGELRYRERQGSTEFRHAPLLLLPVSLERKSARERFFLKWNEEDPQENLSLREKLKVEFGLKMPDFPDPEEFDIGAYFQTIREAIAQQDGWEVTDDAIQLGFFSFSKLLMFLDLDPKKWPEGKKIDGHPLIGGLLGGGFEEADPGTPSGESAFLDKLIPVAELKHVVDCDSSQALAIEAVRGGRNLVIQGPPGTGKSQTIANLIATAVGDGKRVLFVAEKMAALEVVKRRLDNVGLGPLCLELHSNKANKKTVLDELSHTINIGSPARVDVAGSVQQLEETREKLNAHARQMHTPVGAAEQTPFQIIGALAKLGLKTSRPGYRLPDAAAWTMADANKRADTLREYCEHLNLVGDVATHHWRGVAHPPVMRPQAEDLVEGLKPFVASLSDAIARSEELGHALGVPPAQTISELDQQIAVGRQLSDSPEFDRATIGSGVWSAGLDALREALKNGRILSEARSRRAASVAEVAWAVDWTGPRMLIATHGRGLFRFLNGNYRQAINQLRGVMKVDLPKDYAQRLAILDDLIAGYQAQGSVERVKETAKAAFGSVWRDIDTNWDLASSILSWVEKQSGAQSSFDMRKLASDVGDKRELATIVGTSRAAMDTCAAEFKKASEALRLDLQVAMDGSEFEHVELDAFAQRAARWDEDIDGLLTWLAYAEVARRAEALTLQEPMALAANSPEDRPIAIDQFWMAFYLQLLIEATSVYPDLPKFEGKRHDELVEEFRKLDRKRLQVAQVEAAKVHYGAIPTSSMGAVGALKGEMAKKRGHMALRKLIRVCGSPIQAIKPVFMMSPLSVAQFLEPGAIHFDLLVIDEASQVEPVDALGAIARSDQIVVVGDDKQLPPTSFFARVLGGDEDAGEEEGFQVKDLESVLSLCSAKGIPQRMLQWHYRSRHESLIAVSNKEFYESKLFIVPSPDRDRQQSGLRFHHLPHGRFDRGNTMKNHVEAQAIARAVLEHARSNPTMTLGVGAMSVRQRQAITDEIELARRQHPELERFIQAHPNEPFFVKNLENIQGDERAVIFISIGYGRGKSDDKMWQNFGPLNADGGHRRLNVLITRARERCEVFSSITGDDIRVDERSKLGVIALKAFLKYAEQGDLGVPVMSGKGADSFFEEAVQEVLVKHGYQVDNQVGVAGFFIDLAVVDPDQPGRYLLGLECDGAAYHSAPSARDRDRLRQEILEAHGWSIHRIWSTDWFQRQKSETDRLLNAIAAAKSGRRTPTAAPVAEPLPTIERELPLQEANGLSQPYRQAAFKPGNSDLEPHEVPVGSMAFTVTRIVEEEGPIHTEEVVARVRDLWQLGRAGSRIKGAVKTALEHARRQGKIADEDDCWSAKDAVIVPRDRSLAESRSLKRPELLPPQEIRVALVELVKQSHGIRREETFTAIARALGFQATSQQLRDVIELQIERLLTADIIRSDNGVLEIA